MNKLSCQRLRREILIWSQLDHPNITPLLGIALFSELSDLQAMVTPWYEHGSAFHYLKENRPCALERIELAIGVANGLQYLHQLTPVVVHADLKPVNILIDDQKRPRICDFGLSHMIDQANTGLTTTTPHMATLRYTAHEIISREDDEGFSPSTASDVFSLGCVIYEVMTGNLPYRSCKSNQQLMRMTLNGEQPASRPMQRKTTNEKEDRLWDLMENCWGTKPELRPRAEEVWRELKTIASIQSDFLLFPCKPAGNGGSGSCRHILRSKSRRASTGNSQVMEDILGSVSQEDNVIAVMGATGVGKSSFIRVATGNSSVKVGNSLLSCTDKIQPIGCLHHGRKFVFLDTPGFDDTKMSDATILANIAEWLAFSYKKGIKLTGLVYLHRISDNRMSGSSLRTLEMFKHVCGEDALQNVILVTTMGDAVNKSEWTARENALREEFWQPMITSGAQMMRFEQTSESAWNIIDQLSGVRRPIQLQREMVDTGKDLSQTAAGRSLFGWISRKVAEIQALIQTLKDTLKGTRKNPEDAKNAELLAAKEKELKLAQEQKKKLTFASSPFRNWNRRRAATLWTPQ
ncbi:kinase-like protein [Serendipita vermifera]|nr:kinase-like protein [Serendipita vermifera]